MCGQLDRVRSYRDTLYSAELSWREAARLSQAAATLAKAGRDTWMSLESTMLVQLHLCLLQYSLCFLLLEIRLK